MRAYEFDKHRNQQWKEEVKSFGGTCNLIVEIVQYCDDPIEAQKAEFQLIYKQRKIGEAYCNNEGDTSFQRKYPKLRYHLYKDDEYWYFDKKSELFLYCAEKYNLSKRLVNMIIKTGKEYNGAKADAKGLRIIKEGKEHM